MIRARHGKLVRVQPTSGSNGADRSEHELADLLDDFRMWAAERRRDADLLAVAAALHLKQEFDGNISRWTAAGVRHLLVKLFPQIVTMPPEQCAATPDSVDALIDFLDEREIIDAKSAPPAKLHESVAKSTSMFSQAMETEEFFSLDKLFSTRMISAGVDPNDVAAVERFVAAASSGQLGEELRELSQEVFAVDDEDDEPDPVRLATVRLPTDEELSAEVIESPLLRHFRVFAGWLGDGKPVTARWPATVRPADAKELAAVLGADKATAATVTAWAKAAGLARVVHGRLIPVKKAAALHDRPFKLWQRAFDAFFDIGDVLVSTDRGPVVVSWSLPQLLPEIYVPLYTGATVPVPLEFVVENVRITLHDRFAGRERLTNADEQRGWRRGVIGAVAALELLGAAYSRPADAEEAAKIADLIGPDADRTVVGLTGLGLWAVNGYLRDHGYDVPVAGDLSRADFAELVGHLDSPDPRIVEDEIAGWIAARRAETAAAEIGEFICTTMVATERLMAFHALGQTGRAGVAKAREIRGAGGVPGAGAAAWLADVGELDLDDVTTEEGLLGVIEQLAGLHDADRLAESLSNVDVPTRLDLVRMFGEYDHPQRLDLLDAFATQDPDPTVSRAARKLQMKIRSVGVG